MEYISTSNSYSVTKYTYDIAGNALSIADPDGHAPARLTYNDTCNRYWKPLTVANSLGQSTTLGYDYGTNCSNGTGNLTFSIDPNGVTTAYKYDDQLDRVTQIRRAADTAAESQTNIVYDSVTDVSVYRDQAAKNDRKLHSETLYDGFGRPSESRQYENSGTYISTKSTYDSLGHLATSTNPSRMTNGQSDGLGYSTTTGYDALGRVVSVKTADGSTTVTSYTGNQTTVTDPAGKKRQYTNDALGRLTKVVEDPDGLKYKTSYEYDALDDLTKVTQGDPATTPEYETRTFGYDTLRRLTSSTQPESGITQYAYDADGNLTSKIDSRNVTTTYTYDALNRLTKKQYSDGTPTVDLAYDAPSSTAPNGIGRLWSVANANATTWTYYDERGNVASSAQATLGQTYATVYAYDLADSLISEAYPSGRVINTAYDQAERPSTVSGTLGVAAKNYATGIAYAPHGAMRLYGFGNNIWHAVNFNSRMQPYQIWDVIDNDPDKILRSQCLYWGSTRDPQGGCPAPNDSDNNGNLMESTFGYGAGGSTTSPTFDETYRYDGVNRLISVENGDLWSRHFAYDQYSNMWLCGWPGIAANGSAPAANYCSQTPSGIFNTANRIGTGSYDAAGNQLTVAGSNLTYDAENRITKALQPGIGYVDYGYDGNGRRVFKSNSYGSQTIYVYDAEGKLVAEYSLGVGTVSPCQTCYLSLDHLGSTRLVTDQGGNTVSRHDYIPFGEEIQANSGGRDGTFGTQDFVNQKFTGKERDQETGLDYFGARYYGSALGRFTSPDEFKGGFDNLDGQPAFSPGPIGYADLSDPQTLNKYVYTRNNPLRYIDPDGHDFLDYLSGVANALVSDNALGAGRSNGGNEDFRLGQVVGDSVATITGSLEALGGGGEAVVTSPAALTGVGALVPAAGAAVAAHGATTVAVAGGHLVAAAVKASDAPGTSASGQATDQYGNKLGPSGKPMVHETNSNTREGAKNKALSEGSGAVEHSNPTVGKPHFHPTDAEGNKKPTSTHHNYPDN